jgi:hypothetical protein
MDYLIDQFALIQNNCSTDFPYTTSSSTLYVGTATATYAANISTVTGSIAVTLTCAGELVQPMTDSLTCNDLCDQ